LLNAHDCTKVQDSSVFGKLIFNNIITKKIHGAKIRSTHHELNPKVAFLSH
jgi:hypothetical protein